MQSILLGAFALIPAIVLMIFIYKKDRVEKEPVWLVIVLLAVGAFICLPAIPIESLLLSLVSAITQVTNGSYIGYLFAENFIAIALVEEGLKWLGVFIITSKNRNFNCLFDGVVYTVSVSLGFAALENILYCVQNGWGTAIMRMILSVPGHCFFGLFMGMFYTSWHIRKKAKEQEAMFMKNGALPQGPTKVRTGLYIFLSIAVPTALHGFYDFMASLGSGFATVILLLFVSGLYVFFFIKVNRMSRQDAPDRVHSLLLLFKLYPGLSDRLRANPMLMSEQR